MSSQYPTDLIILVADKDTEFALKALLARPQNFNIRSVDYLVIVHTAEKDPGVLLRGHDLLSLYAKHTAHALVVFDHDGCGQEGLSRAELEAQVEARLAASGWDDRAAVIVPDPELEIWVWSDSPQVDAVLGWKDRQPDLRKTLIERGFLAAGQVKPIQPKAAMHYAMRIVKRQRSSVLYQEIARKVSINRCIDPAFMKLKATLHRWFAL